jgi:hypothetical protein
MKTAGFLILGGSILFALGVWPQNLWAIVALSLVGAGVSLFMWDLSDQMKKQKQ